MSLVKPLQLIAHFTIQPGKTDEFKKIVSKCIEVVRQKKPERAHFNTTGTSTQISLNVKFLKPTGIRRLFWNTRPI